MAVDADSAEQLDEPTAEHEDVAPEIDVDDKPRRGSRAFAVSLAIVVTVTGLAGWLGFRAVHTHRDHLQRNLYMHVARQGALNLTTISFTEAEADVQRIVDSATGTFRDDFKKRSQPFIDVVQQAQSKSQGVITEAALESEGKDSAQVLVAVTVSTSLAGVPEQQPRAWRMRITVQKVGDDAKVSNVEFVP